MTTGPREVPLLAASNIHYELSARDRGIAMGGIGAVHLLARRSGLIANLDRRLHLLKVHLPYHESDHVLTIAYNILAGGDCLEDLELLRQDEGFLDALGAKRIPDPTTAGDFCRRFDEAAVWTLMDAINQTRQTVWALQPPEFFKRPSSTPTARWPPPPGSANRAWTSPTTASGAITRWWSRWPTPRSRCSWSTVLAIVPATCREPPGRTTGAAACLDKSIVLCREAGFRQILLRGDTDFSQTAHLDRWDAQAEVKFLFGLDATKPLIARAEALPAAAWKKLQRPARYQVRSDPPVHRARPENVKEPIVVAREFKNIRLVSEDVAEFRYQPTACPKAYRVVVVRKNLSVEQGEAVLFDDVRYFFYITNLDDLPPEQIVLVANDRCDQENLIQQLKSGVQALKMPTGDRVSN